jgi:hypothetical protein
MRNRPMAWCVIACLCVAGSAGAQKKAAPPPVPVFVTSVGAADGFTDPDGTRQDSVKDLKGSLAYKKKTLALVEKREDAVVVLTVVSREKGGFWGPGNTLRVKMAVPGFETELAPTVRGGAIWQGYSQWAPVADRVIKEVDKWVQANRDRLAVPEPKPVEK